MEGNEALSQDEYGGTRLEVSSKVVKHYAQYVGEFSLVKYWKYLSDGEAFSPLLFFEKMNLLLGGGLVLVNGLGFCEISWDWDPEDIDAGITMEKALSMNMEVFTHDESIPPDVMMLICIGLYAEKYIRILEIDGKELL